ncbi:MAG: AMP-binding protein [Bdellovibrionota bacterium]
MKSLDVLHLYPEHKYTLSTLLESRVAQQRRRECLLFENKEKYSWETFHEWVAGLSGYIASMGFQEGDRVAICSRNSALFVALYFALADQGLVAVPINPDLKNEEALFILKHSETKALLFQNKFNDLAIFASKELPLKLIELETTHYSLKLKKLSHKGQAEKPSLILYTSGTTGFPKGVVHSQKTTVMAGEAFVERMQLTPEDRLLCILPFFHINALFYSMMGTFAAGATLIVTEKFSASKFWELATQTAATEVNIIAAIGSILGQRDRKEFNPQHKIKKIYGAPVSVAIEKLFREEFKVPVVLEGYGMTEIPGAINNQIHSKWKVGTMGVAARHPDTSLQFTQLKILDDSLNEIITTDEPGELVVKTPLLMMEYYKDPEQTKNSFTEDGYFKTGDLVKKDKDGFYVFVTRKKDIIRRRGENISGAEIDRCVMLHPGIAECAAIGVPSNLGEEEVFLAIVPREGVYVSEKDISEWCHKNLSPIKCPRYIKKFPSLPHTATARVAKFKLKQIEDLLIAAIEF